MPREQFHTLRLNEWLTHLHPAVNAFSRQVQQFFLHTNGDAVRSHQMAVQVLANVREQQALSLAYFDCFWVFAVVALCLAFLVVLMKRSVAEKGAHIGGE